MTQQTQEAAEAGLSKQAARVLSRLRNPDSEDGYVRRQDFGISTSGSAVKAVLDELRDAGFVIRTLSSHGHRLDGWGGPVEHHHVCEKAAEPPITVKLPSAVLGSGSSTSSQVEKEEPAHDESAGPIPPAAREHDAPAPSSPEEPPQVHGTVPFAGKAMDRELYAIARCIDHIDCLPQEARARVAAYVASRYL